MWPKTRITFGGDGHYARPEAMDFCEENGISYLFSLTGTKPLVAKVREVAVAVARIEATRLSLDIRFVVTNIDKVAPRILYESLYCARGQAENLINVHKAQLASDRTFCRRAVANQVRLVFHTAAYWLVFALRDAVPTIRDLARAEFATIRLRLLKIAVRVQEHVNRIRLAFAASYPDADLFIGLAAAFRPRSTAATP